MKELWQFLEKPAVLAIAGFMIVGGVFLLLSIGAGAPVVFGWLFG